MRWSTPAELQPYGWAMVDVWIPLMGVLYQGLMGGIEMGLGGWTEQEALGMCLVLTVGIFMARTVWNAS